MAGNLSKHFGKDKEILREQMNNSAEVLVVGLGAMGSAALFHLARSGVDVLGIDAYHPPHNYGSSHGETRVIREAYFEHPVYVPLVQRAYDLWAELESEIGEELYLKTGGLMIGRQDSAVVTGAIRSASEHGLPHEILSVEQIKQRAPALNPADDMAGVFEPRAGILYPERCVAAHLSLAREHGAAIRTGERLLEWRSLGSEIAVKTDRGTYRAKKLVLAIGAWSAQALPELASLLHVERQVLLWFKVPNVDIYRPGQLPIHLWEYEPGRMFYGFPDLGDGLKIAFHHQGEPTSPEEVDRSIRPSDVKKMRELMQQFLPEIAGNELLRGTVCLYTNTPDEHFIIDVHPRNPNVVIASPCSGHGFKFASSVGEILAALASGNTPKVDLSLFALRRFLP